MGVAILKKTEYTTNEVAEILGVSDRTVRRLAQKEGWKDRRVSKGAIVTVYYDLQDIESYCKKKKTKLKLIDEKNTEIVKVEKKEINSIDELPDWNKKKALVKFYLCTELLKKYENSDKSKGEIIKEFVAEVPIKYKDKLEHIQGFSESSLRRWYGVFKDNMDKPYVLAENHGHNKGKSNLTLKQREMVLRLYGDKNKPTIMKVFEQMIIAGEKVTYPVISKFINDLPDFLLDNLRQGKKENKDDYEPFAMRNYLEKPNFVWMSDGHDIEMMVRNPKTGKPSSPKLIVWQDHASRMWVGWALSWVESTEPIVEALKDGIEKWGRPDNLYTDNGRAYKSKELKGDPDTIGDEELIGIYRSLGIGSVHHALPYNAKAKAIERSFRDFKETFAKSFVTYKGGHILERPERLKTIVKKNNDEDIMEYEDLKPVIEAYIEYRNHEYYKIRGGHRGKGMNGRTPLERMNEECPLEQRVILDNDKLRLMCMYQEIRKVQQAGLEFKGNLYIAPEIFQHIGHKVRVKYDHRDLSKVYVYKLTGEYLFEAEPRNFVSFFESVEEIKYVSGLKKSHRKAVKKANELGLEIREKDVHVKETMNRDMNRLEEKRDVIDIEVEFKKPWE